MAGDWIPMRMDLSADPAVISIAADTRITEDAVVGKLLRLWSWANCHTTDGEAPGLTAKWIDRHVGKTGFGDAMSKTGWILIHERGVTFTSFERYNGKGAKRRLEAGRRVSEHRERKRKCNAESVTSALQNAQLEKRREEKRRTPPSEQGGVGPPPSADEPSSPVPLCETETRIRRWVGDRISASDRNAIAKAELQAQRNPPVTIHHVVQPASVLFARAVDEAIASGGSFRSASGFLKLVGTIEARCARDGCWPGEGLERQNGHEPPVGFSPAQQAAIADGIARAERKGAKR